MQDCDISKKIFGTTCTRDICVHHGHRMGGGIAEFVSLRWLSYKHCTLQIVNLDCILWTGTYRYVCWIHWPHTHSFNYEAWFSLSWYVNSHNINCPVKPQSAITYVEVVCILCATMIVRLFCSETINSHQYVTHILTPLFFFFSSSSPLPQPIC